MNRYVKVAAVGLVCVGLASCGTIGGAVSKLNPFNKNKGPQAVASKGERIPVLTFDQKVEPSEALKGADFQLPEARPVTAWPVPGGSPEQAMENVQAAASFQVAWKHDIGDGSNRKRQITAPPVAIDGRIYTMDGRAEVVASDAKDGGQVWRSDLSTHNKRDKEAYGGGLAVGDGKVFVSSGYRFIAALDAATGKTLWRKAVDSPIHGAPTVADGKVYAIDVDNQIIALDAKTGDQSWSYQAIVEPARILKASSPAVSGDSIVAPFSSGELVALRTANGNVLWNEALSRTSRTNALSEIRDIPGRPAIYKGDVYAASQSGVFAAVDLRTGSSRWQLPISSINSPWPAGDVVYIVSKAGEVIAVNRENGQVYWLTDLAKGRGKSERAFFVGRKRVVRPIVTGPILAGDKLILVDNWGDAVALDPKTGAVKQRIKIGDAAYISPIAYDGMVYVVTDDGKLVAIR
jgi:outer membrane protein assembly factor BamB